MIKRLTTASALMLVCGGGLMADFTYEQSSKITGGMMASMMKFAGAFSKSAREPQVSTISVKGDRMVSRHGDTAQVIDLDRETITDINFKNKTYSTITFAQMTQALQDMSRKMQQERSKSKDASANAEVKFKASLNDTGQARQIQGMDAKQTIMKLDMEATDKESGQKGSFQVLADMWLVPSVAGYDEVRNFYQRMGQKLAWTPGGMGFASTMMQPGMAEGMSELYKQASKLDGVPVLQITKMGSVAEGQDLSSLPSQPQGEQPEMPSAGQVAGQAAGQSAAGAAGSRLGRAGALGGALGGFGGLGRRKKEAAKQEEPAPPPQAEPEQQQQAAGGALLMELTTELTAFSSAPVDSSKFEVPAGFKQVENEMLKRSR